MMRRLPTLLVLHWLLITIAIDQWQQVHAAGEQTGVSVADRENRQNSAKGYLIETSFILTYNGSYYTGSQLSNLIVDEDRKLVSISYSSEKEHLNDHIVGLSRIQQHWDLERRVENRIDLSYGSCHSNPIDPPSSIFSRSPQADDKEKCRSEPVRLILGNYFLAKETRQLVMPIYNHNLLRWVLADFQEETDKRTDQGWEINGIDHYCLHTIDTSKGTNTYWIDHRNSLHTKFIASPSKSDVEITYHSNELPVSMRIRVNQLAKMELAKGASDIELNANTKLCHETLGRLRMDYPIMDDSEKGVFVSDDTRESLIANLIKLYSLDSRRITKLEINQDKRLAAGFITVNVELLGKLSKFEAGKKPVELPVQQDLNISQKNLWRMLNMSSISLPTPNTDECVTFCRRHDCNTLVHCQQWNECHIYLYPVGLPGSFMVSSELICKTIEMRPKYKALAGWTLQEVKRHLTRVGQRSDKSELNLNIKMQNQMVISPSKIKFDIINNPRSDEFIEIPEDRYRLVDAGHKLDDGAINSTLLVVKNVNRIQDCVELCDKQETCTSMSYCQSTENSCVLSKENYMTFARNRTPQINSNGPSIIEDHNCLIVGKRLSGQFHEVLNQTKPRADLGPEEWVNEELEYCAVRCVIDNIRGQPCNSFEIRRIMGINGKPECYHQTNQAGRGKYDGPFRTYHRDILLLFKPMSSHVLRDDVKINQKDIVNEEQCAQLCLDKSDCGAFEYCYIRGASYMEFHPWCSIGLAPTISSEPTEIHNGNLFCSVYKLKNQINWSVPANNANNTSEANDHHDQSETKDKPKEETGWSNGSIVLLLFTVFAMAAGLNYFVRKRSRNNSNKAEAPSPTGESSNARSQDNNDGISIELQDVNIDVNPKVVSTIDNSSKKLVQNNN